MIQGSYHKQKRWHLTPEARRPNQAMREGKLFGSQRVGPIASVFLFCNEAVSPPCGSY
jgi:hypothetical protein